MFVKGYSEFSLSKAGPIHGDFFGAYFKLDTDVSLLLPYINAVVNGATYYDKPPYVHFDLDGIRCALYAHDVVMASFNDEHQARQFVNRLISFLNDLYEKRNSITPNYQQYKPISVLDIYKLLPKTNCGECGFQTCMAYAGALRLRQTTTDKCPDFTNPIMEKAVYPVYDNDGNLTTTIEIDIDTSKMKLDLEKSIETLEEKEAGLTEEKQIISEKEMTEIQTDLTSREIEVLQMIVDGATNNEISDQLSISPHTVKSHVVHIFNKLGVNDRTQAAVWATRKRIV
ncbi:MAG: LuxR C-terminal-related transcriptional regulator [Desulfobacterales bacterium]|nr:LuxR C-terminal-related transcriptional regulator [Desulfobacterales bacterium]